MEDRGFRSLGVKLPVFSGDSSEFEDWCFGFKSFVGMIQPDYVEFLEAAQVSDRVVSNLGLSAEAQVASKKLFWMLSSAAQGTARILLRKQTPGEGLEAWRQMHIRYAQVRPGAMLGSLQAVLSFDTTANLATGYYDKLEAFELLVQAHHRRCPAGEDVGNATCLTDM